MHVKIRAPRWRFVATIGSIYALASQTLWAQSGANPVSAPSVAAPATPVGTAIQQLLLTRRDPEMQWPDIRDVATVMSQMYQAHGWSPLWFRDGTATRVAHSVSAVLGEAETRGLHPDDYDARLLAARLAEPADRNSTYSSTAQLAAADVALTADVLRFAHALRFGRIRPTTVHAALHLPQDTMNLAVFVQALIADESRANDAASFNSWVRAQFDALEPPWTHYRLLRQTLNQYRLMASDSAPIQPGLTPSLVKERMQHIELALERWRWLPHTFSAPPIFINIPAFRLYAFGARDDDEESTLLNMKVAVGKAFRRQTPVFSATLKTVTFSPYWDVPVSIAAAELLPKARRNPAYLTRSHMEIVSNARDRVLPLTESSFAQVSAGTARIRQRPGPDNALGGVKFIFPNKYDVYLHDTPVQSTFALARRDVSHGCIRVAEPARLAAFVLRNQPSWTAARIDSAMHLDRPLSVPVSISIPVFIVYTTVITRANGQTAFFDDIYGHDRTLARVLLRGYPYE